MSTKNIMIVGVGGQGTLLASRILGNCMLAEGYDVKVSEVHGMSQRGGSVVTYLKYGDAVYSPIIGKGEADVILAFEQLEALRAMPYVKKGGKIIEKGTICKMARGEMVRYMAEHQITGPEDIQSFDRLDYVFDPERSDESTYVFVKRGKAPCSLD